MHRHSSFGDPSPWFTPHHTHKTSKATVAALTPTQLWFGVSELTEGKRRAAHLKNVTKNCTRSMKLLCWEKAIYERGKKKKKGRTESEICFNKGDFKRRGQHYTLKHASFRLKSTL